MFEALESRKLHLSPESGDFEVPSPLEVASPDEKPRTL